jgi:hypothetical protein
LIHVDLEHASEQLGSVQPDTLGPGCCIEEGVEFAFDELWQVSTGSVFGHPAGAWFSKGI